MQHTDVEDHSTNNDEVDENRSRTLGQYVSIGQEQQTEIDLRQCKGPFLNRRRNQHQ